MLELIPIAANLMATLVPELMHLLGKDKEADVAEKVIQIAKKVTGKEDPVEASAAIFADPTLAMQFQLAVMSNKLELQKLGLREKQMYVSDTQDARKYRDHNVFALGVIILISFMLVMTSALVSIYFIATGKAVIDPGMIAAVFSLVGTIIGYFASNAQQVVGFFFGSSQGSSKHGDALADAVKVLKG